MELSGSLAPEAITDHRCLKAARDAPYPSRSLNGHHFHMFIGGFRSPRKKGLRMLAVLFDTTYAFDLFSSREDAFLALPVCSCHVTHRDVATHTEE